MIIAKTPLRISLGGGGTDLPSYYREYGGFVISAAIDKYVYITANRSFFPGYVLKYSEMEHASSRSSIRHPLFREALNMHDVGDRIELTSVADVPPAPASAPRAPSWWACCTRSTPIGRSMSPRRRWRRRRSRSR